MYDIVVIFLTPLSFHFLTCKNDIICYCVLHEIVIRIIQNNVEKMLYRIQNVYNY